MRFKNWRTRPKCVIVAPFTLLEKRMTRSFAFTLGLVSLLATAPTTATSAVPSVAATAAFDEYSDGWEEGWSEGWKYVKGPYSIPPIAPIAPIPRIGQDKYKDGYNRGFVAGSARARR